MSSMLPNVLLLGPQGSGKGTQADRLATDFGYHVIGMGQLLRDEVIQKTDRGQQIKKLLARGEFVPDRVAEDIFREHLAAIPLDQPIIIEGYPRRLSQAQAIERIFESHGRPLPIAVYLNIPRGVVLERLAERYVCAECGKLINAVPGPLKKLLCPKCGGPVETRIDDRPEIIEIRLNLFYSETLPVVDYYRRLHRLVEIDGRGPIDEVTVILEKRLGLEPKVIFPHGLDHDQK